ncbi:MAG: hypothetical protein HFH72_15045 [Lachnospiraceae bacterium]|nr:hypothetical protein [Lachnospiraceae bacterium]
MRNKNWKKVIALLAAVSVVTAGIPGIVQYATATGTEEEVSDNGTASEGEGAEGEEKEEEEPQEVSENGEVVMKNAVEKKPESEWITMKDYEVIAESDTYKMYFYEPTLSIMLENKETGKILESTLSDEKDDWNSNQSWNSYMKSGIVLTAIKGNKNGFQLDLVSSPHTLDVTKNDKGFSAKIFFSEYKVGLTMEVSLEGDNLVVNIPDDSIVEEQEGSYISTISPYPFMGYSFLDEKKGYMLIPDGNGALINLDNKEGRYTTGFNQMIYGQDAGFEEKDAKALLWKEVDMVRDANEVIAPIFGMAHTEEQIGYLAVVEKGEKRASIEAQPNGATVNYNRCFANFKIRDVFVQPLNNSNSGTVPSTESDHSHSDLQVRYMLLSGENVSYSAMAETYRNYLLDNKLISIKDNSYNTRVDFLGTEREKFLLGTKAVTMTTTENVEELYKEMQDDGVSSLLTLYKGWQKGGLYNLPVTKYKADSHIGGTSKLTKLIQDSEEKNYHIYLFNDALRLNPGTDSLNFNMVKQVNKRTLEEYWYAEVYRTFYYLTPKKAAEAIEGFADSYTNHDVSNLALSGVSNTLFTYSFKNKFYSRNDVAKDYSDALDKIDENVNLILEEPAAYLWKNTDAFLDMPLGSSDYMYVDEEIPFLSMVLKGVIPMYSDYVNFEANKNEFFLQMVEAGVYPSFYLTYEKSSDLIYTNSSDLYSTEFSTYRDVISEYDKALREVNDAVKDAFITKHEKTESGVTVVTYSNGVKIYVNYTGTAQTVDGVTVEGMSYSYKVGEAE